MSDPNYIVFVRVPRPRANFIDPPTHNWDSEKDNLLWNILTSKDKGSIDWNDLARQFDVTPEFVLRQANFLNERNASHLKAEVRRATVALRSSPHGVSAVPTVSSRPSSFRRPSYVLPPAAPASDAVNFGSRPLASRNVTSGYPPQRVDSNDSHPESDWAEAHRPYVTAKSIDINDDDYSGNPYEAIGSDEDDMEVSSNGSSSPGQSRIIRRPPTFQDRGTRYFGGDEEDDDSEPAFRAHDDPSDVSPAQSQSSGGMKSTLRAELRRKNTVVVQPKQHKHRHNVSQTSDSSSSSFVTRIPGSSKENHATARLGRADTKKHKSAGGDSAKHSKISSKSSEGLRSIGSSYSDLDSESFSNSVTDSAMVDAYVGMQGTAASSRLTLGGSINRLVNRRGGL